MLLRHAAQKDDLRLYINPATPKDKLSKLVEPIRPTPMFVRGLGIDRPPQLVANTPASTQSSSTLSAGGTFLASSTGDTSQSPTLEIGIQLTRRIPKSALTDIEKDVLEELLDDYAHEYKRHELLTRWNNLKEVKKGQDIEM